MVRKLDGDWCMGKRLVVIVAGVFEKMSGGAGVHDEGSGGKRHSSG